MRFDGQKTHRTDLAKIGIWDWVSMWLDLTEPEAEVLFDLDGPT